MLLLPHVLLAPTFTLPVSTARAQESATSVILPITSSWTATVADAHQGIFRTQQRKYVSLALLLIRGVLLVSLHQELLHA